MGKILLGVFSGVFVGAALYELINRVTRDVSEGLSPPRSGVSRSGNP